MRKRKVHGKQKKRKHTLDAAEREVPEGVSYSGSCRRTVTQG